METFTPLLLPSSSPPSHATAFPSSGAGEEQSLSLLFFGAATHVLVHLGEKKNHVFEALGWNDNDIQIPVNNCYCDWSAQAITAYPRSNSHIAILIGLCLIFCSFPATKDTLCYELFHSTILLVESNPIIIVIDEVYVQMPGKVGLIIVCGSREGWRSTLDLGDREQRISTGGTKQIWI